jgi:hypothetical protein
LIEFIKWIKIIKSLIDQILRILKDYLHKNLNFN